MNKKTEMIKEGLLVTLGSFVASAIAFLLYFLIFRLFQAMANHDGSFGFVSWIRVGYGIIWIVFCFIIYRTKIHDWLKASILSASLTAFIVAIGVQSYRTPIIAYLVMFLAAAIGVFLLYKMKKKWYHYYAIALSIIAALFYL